MRFSIMLSALLLLVACSRTKPTDGQDYFRADSTMHTEMAQAAWLPAMGATDYLRESVQIHRLVCSFNGGEEHPCTSQDLCKLKFEARSANGYRIGCYSTIKFIPTEPEYIYARQDLTPY